MDGNGTEDTENVIRLPRDWVGPPEELVPMGSRARAEDRDRAAAEELPQAADDFWGESSGALQHAIEGPADPVPANPDRPRAGASPVDSWRRTRPRRRLAPARIPARRPAVRTTVAAMAIAVVAVIAVVGMTEGATSRPGPARSRPHHTKADARQTAAAVVPERSLLERPSTRMVSVTDGDRARRHRGVARHSAPGPTRRPHVHRRTPAVRSSTPVSTTQPSPPTETSTTPPAAPANATGGSTATDTATAASASATGGSSLPPGPTGHGSASGCSPKC